MIDWYSFCRKRKLPYLWHGATVILTGFFACLFIRKTYILPVHGGGRYLFGGTYLSLFYIGILLSDPAANLRIESKKGRVGLVILTAILTVTWESLKLCGKLPFDGWMRAYLGKGVNPPGVELIVYALLVLAFLYAAFTSLERAQNGWIKRAVDLLCFLGRNTLYVFMYHLLVRDILLKCFPVLNSNVWLKRWLVFWPMIFLPAIGAGIWKKCKQIIRTTVD